MRTGLLLLLLFLLSNCHSTRRTGSEMLLFSDDFNYRSKDWVVESATGDHSKVEVDKGQLLLDTRGGVTVWLNRKFKGNIRIEYKRKVVVEGGINDRLSDLNTFWMATDPANKNFFTRNGVLEQYDSLQLYYVGMGGNTNKTTRFRKYEGNGARTLLKEYTDTAHLLQANRYYDISIVVQDEWVRYSVDGRLFFEFRDPKVLKEGYFGFRSTKSRQAIDHIRIYRLP